jgi:tight adherence protein B
MASNADDESSLDHVSAVVERLAVLLAAGIPPAAAWRYLAESEVESSFASRIVRAVSEVGAEHPIGEALREAVEAELSAARSNEHGPKGRASPRSGRAISSFELSAWRGLAAAWSVATESGAPLAQGLLDFAASLRALAQARRDASVALSGPRSTAKLVLALPLVGVLFGMALGFDTLGTLVATIPGLVCLIGGGSLLLAARFWNRRLVDRASPTDATPGLVLDLFAISVSGGASIDRARDAVSRAVERCGIADLGQEAEPVLALARRAGIPPGALLRREANRVRRDAKSEADRKAAQLAVTLMMPLGLCVLPAFMLVGVAPLMIAVLSSTVSAF